MKPYACIEDKTVYGWAIHYFEEDDIQGKLFNLDGSEYEPPKPVKKETPKVEVKEKPKQPSLFDFTKRKDCDNEPQAFSLFTEKITFERRVKGGSISKKIKEFEIILMI